MFVRARSLFVVMTVALAGAGAAGVIALRQPRERAGSTGPAASVIQPSKDTGYAYAQADAASPASAHLALPKPGKAFADGRAQWPADGKEQAKAIQDRLARVAAAVNLACGTGITVMLGETGRGGDSSGTGIVHVDFTLLWRVSEDALAVLMAHEFAHEVLGHTRDLATLRQQMPNKTGRMQQLRELERQADAQAGRILARTSYDPQAFRELLAQVQDTEWSDPQMRSYYPNKDRLDTLLEAYRGERDAESQKAR